MKKAGNIDKPAGHANVVLSDLLGRTGTGISSRHPHLEFRSRFGVAESRPIQYVCWGRALRAGPPVFCSLGELSEPALLARGRTQQQFPGEMEGEHETVCCRHPADGHDDRGG